MEDAESIVFNANDSWFEEMFLNNNFELVNLVFFPLTSSDTDKAWKIIPTVILKVWMIGCGVRHLAFNLFFIIQIACGLTRVTKSLGLQRKIYSFRGLSINGIEEGRATALAVAWLRIEQRRRILIKLEFRQSLCVVVMIVASISTTQLNEYSLMENFAWRRSYQMFVFF